MKDSSSPQTKIIRFQYIMSVYMLMHYYFSPQPPKRPNALCGICLKGPESNKKGLQEDLIHCSQCENSGTSKFVPKTSQALYHHAHVLMFMYMVALYMYICVV